MTATPLQLAIADGLLTTPDGASPFAEPIFIFKGTTYAAPDLVANQPPESAETRVNAAYDNAVENGRRFTRAEYNLVARFCGLPSANLCSGE
ncbi:hypothetical protein [Propionivibrio dicarboxylicus]|uniref:Uncharacterized protein n=1 Tax=Propionivibrio dicarboxylicus TaxID=83767 RepID=A0A1G8JYK5_9RHOO|nr:hypothetical protein [Propionivibrio dicarboxylicus]SDI36296.1 hypothetical protein SAMN05660652_03296 [Propionivibrio dicarboxylicus]